MISSFLLKRKPVSNSSLSFRTSLSPLILLAQFGFSRNEPSLFMCIWSWACDSSLFPTEEKVADSGSMHGDPVFRDKRWVYPQISMRYDLTSPKESKTLSHLPYFQPSSIRKDSFPHDQNSLLKDQIVTFIT